MDIHEYKYICEDCGHYFNLEDCDNSIGGDPLKGLCSLCDGFIIENEFYWEE